MLPLPAGRQASAGVVTSRYERHRPERTLLYQLVEDYVDLHWILTRVLHSRMAHSDLCRILLWTPFSRSSFASSLSDSR